MKTLVTKLIALFLLTGSANAFAQGGGFTINANQTTDLTKPQNPNNPTKPEIPPEIRTMPEEEVKNLGKGKDKPAELCGKKDRLLDHREILPWKKKKTTVVDMSMKPNNTSVSVVVIWVREVKEYWYTSSCEKPKGHAGACRGKAVLEVKTMTYEQSMSYEAGQAIEPPKDHITDRLPLK